MAEQRSRWTWLFDIVGGNKVHRENKRITRSFNEMQKATRQLRGGVLGMQTSLSGAYATLVATGLALRQTVSAFAEYTDAQARVRTVLATIDGNYRRNYRSVQVLSEGIAVDLGYSTIEANQGMETLLQTGLGMHRSMRVARNAMTLARVGNMEVSDAIQFTVDTMRMFEREMVDSRESYQQFSQRMGSQLAVSANMASTTMEQLRHAFSYAGTEMSQMGYTSRETMAALAGMSVIGLRGSTAGTRLRGAIAALLRPSQSLYREVAQYGIAQDEVNQIMFDAQGRQRPLQEGMNQLAAIFARLPNQAARSKVAVMLFGRRALAAGFTLARMTSAARKTDEIMGALTDTQQLNTTWTRMQEARMNSFGMQVQQLKHGLTDLSIAFGETLFGAMQEGEEGFGTYVRNVARGIRLSRSLGDMTEEQRRQWEALSPEVRQTAQEFRETFEQVATGIKVIGGWLIAIGKWAAAHPYLTGALIMLKATFGGLLPVLTIAGRLILRLVGVFRTLGVVGTGVAGGIVALWAGVIDIGPRISNIFQGIGARVAGLGSDFDEMNTKVDEFLGIWASIPVIGPLARLIGRLAYLVNRAVEISRTIGERKAEARGGISEEERGRRVARMAARTNTVEEARAAVVTQEYNEAMHKLAAFTYTSGITTAAGLTRRLQEVGLSGESLTNTVQDIQRMHEQQGQTLNAETRAMTTLSQRLWGMNTVVEQASRSLAHSRSMMEEWTRIAAQATGTAGAPSTGPSAPPAGDVMIRRSGVIPFAVSSGDMIVSKQHLAAAVGYRRGQLVDGETTGRRQMAGPTPIEVNVEGGMDVPVVINIDGREIARAVGRAHVRQMERGGVQFRPGSRRQLRETGFADRGL